MFDVLVIGAGASGLSCCHRLLKHQKDLKIKVLEAKDRVGGRIFHKTLKTVNGNKEFDLGGQWVGKTQIHVMRLLREFNLDVYEQFISGNTVNVMSYNEVFYTKSPLDVIFTSFLFAYDVSRGIKRIQELSQQLDIDDPLSHPKAMEWDNMPMGVAKNWLFKHQWSKKAFDVAFLTIFGFDVNQSSFLYVLLYIKCAGGIAPLVDEEVHGNAQEFKVEKGMFSLIDCLTETIGQEHIELNSPVDSVKQKIDSCTVVTKDGREYKTKYVVCAIPPHLIQDIKFSPNLPKTRQIFDYVKVGSLIKCIITYSECFWRKDGLSGVALHWPYYRGDDTSICPVSMSYDATSPTGTPALVGFIGGSLADKLSDKTDKEIKQAIVNSFSVIFGEKAKSPIDVCYQDWSKVDYNGGCPVTYSLPGAVTKFGNVSLKERHGRVYFAGTETATLWRGFVSGAIQSGERAADEILLDIDPSYDVKDEIKWENIAIPSLLSQPRNTYYTLNGVLLTGIAASIGLASFIVHKFFY